MNLANLIKEAQQLAGRVDSSFNTRVRRWINEAQIEWATAVPWPTLVKEETFTADGTYQLVLPQRVMTVLWAGDKTNLSDIKPAKFWDKEYPGSFFQRSTGKPQFWRPMGNLATLRTPTYGVINVKTTVTDSTTVFIGGLGINTDASGTADYLFYQDEEVLVPGTAVVSTTKEFYQIDTIGKDDYTEADFTVWDNSSNVLARMHAKSYHSEYQQIELIHVPVAGTEIVVQYLVRPQTLVNNSQVPHTSVNIDYLIWYAAANMHDAQGQAQEGALKRAHAKGILDNHIHKLKAQGDKDWRAMPEHSYWGFEDDMIAGSGY